VIGYICFILFSRLFNLDITKTGEI